MSAQGKENLCVTVRFSDKLEQLMRSGAHSNLSLGKALGGVAHTTVARWREGSIPRGKAARALADYFKVSVEVLTDDSRDLPAPSPPIVPPLTPAEREAFDKKSLQDFTAEDWQTLATHYPEEARELAANVQQIEQAAQVIAATKAQVTEQLRAMFAGIAKLLPAAESEHAKAERDLLKAKAKPPPKK